MTTATNTTNIKNRAYKKLALHLQSKGITKSSHQRFFFDTLESAANFHAPKKNFVKIVERKMWLDFYIYQNGKLLETNTIGYKGYQAADTI